MLYQQYIYIRLRNAVSRPPLNPLVGINVIIANSPTPPPLHKKKNKT